MAPSASFGHGQEYSNELPTIQELEENVMVSKTVAESVVKVVKRCEEAKENNNLGK